MNFKSFAVSYQDICFNVSHGSSVMHWCRFGTTQRDEHKLLAPLYQCCMIRLSTADRLLALYTGPERLSDLMRRSLKTDVLESVLTEAHLAALDRRLAIVLDEIYQCTQNFPHRPVIINDGQWSIDQWRHQMNVLLPVISDIKNWKRHLVGQSISSAQVIIRQLLSPYELLFSSVFSLGAWKYT